MGQKLISMTRKSGRSENGESQSAQAVKWLATSFLCMGGIGPRDLAPAARPRIGPQPDLVQWSLRVARSGRARTVSLSLCRWAQPGQFSQVTGTVANMETMDPTEAEDLVILSPHQSIHQPSQTLVISSSESGRSGPPGLACRRGRRRAQAQSESESRLRPADRESEPEPGRGKSLFQNLRIHICSGPGRL